MAGDSEREEWKDVHDWGRAFEGHWSYQLDRIKQRAERVNKQNRQSPSTPGKDNHENKRQ